VNVKNVQSDIDAGNQQGIRTREPPYSINSCSIILLFPCDAERFRLRFSFFFICVLNIQRSLGSKGFIQLSRQCRHVRCSTFSPCCAEIVQLDCSCEAHSDVEGHTSSGADMKARLPRQDCRIQSIQSLLSLYDYLIASSCSDERTSNFGKNPEMVDQGDAKCTCEVQMFGQSSKTTCCVFFSVAQSVPRVVSKDIVFRSVGN